MRRRYTVFDLPPISRFLGKHKTLTLIAAIVIMITMFGMQYMKYQKQKEIVAACTASTEGTVIRKESRYRKARKGGTRYRGQVSFEVDGKQYTSYTAWQSSAIVNTGVTVRVWYDPEDPARNCTDSTKTASLNLARPIGFAILLIVLAAVSVAAGKSQKNGGSAGGSGGGGFVKKEFDPYSFDSCGGDVGGVQAPDNPYEQPKSYDDIFNS